MDAPIKTQLLASPEHLVSVSHKSLYFCGLGQFTPVSLSFHTCK